MASFVTQYNPTSFSQISPADQFANTSLSIEVNELKSSEPASNSISTKIIVAGAVIVMAASTYSATASAGESYILTPVTQEAFSNVSKPVGGVVSDGMELAVIDYRYRALSSAIDALGHLDEDEAHYIEPSTVESSKAFLEILHAFHVPPPRIFPHGGDAVVFEWQRDDGLRYVTFDEGVARLRDFDAQSEYHTPAFLHLDREDQMSILIRALGGRQWWVKQSNSSL